MARLDEVDRYVTDLGRVASHYSICRSSIVTYSEHFHPNMTLAEIFSMIAQSTEFADMQLRRDEEMNELNWLARDQCPVDVRGAENNHDKVIIMLQAYISRSRVATFSLVADMNHVRENAPRICRALFEVATIRKWASLAKQLLTLSKAVERRIWPHQHVLRQFEPALSPHVLSKLEDYCLTAERLTGMETREIAAILRNRAAAETVKGCLGSIPNLDLEVNLQPITRSVLRVQLTIKPNFTWRDNAYGDSQKWHIWVEDSENEHIYHSEQWSLTKEMMHEGNQRLAFTISIPEPLPAQFHIRATSDSWLGSEAFLPMSSQNLVVPEVQQIELQQERSRGKNRKAVIEIARTRYRDPPCAFGEVEVISCELVEVELIGFDKEEEEAHILASEQRRTDWQDYRPAQPSAPWDRLIQSFFETKGRA